MNNNRLLIVLSKNPEAGMVKTRLAKSIGDKNAIDIYEILCQHTARIAEMVHAKRMVVYSRFIPSSDLIFNDTFIARLQKGNDLGERMLHAIESGFESGFHHVVLIGTDCYELNPAILDDAFSRLEQADAVIGPASDGGFYLIGMKRVIPELFLDRKWSNPVVLKETITILKQLDTSYELLEELSDIDTFDDLKKSPLWTKP